jgi:hypothetical protein
MHWFICIDCEKRVKRTGNSQKRCPRCAKIHYENYWKSPACRSYRKAYYARPEIKAHRLEYNRGEKAKAYHKIYDASATAKIKRAAYARTTKAKTRLKLWAAGKKAEATIFNLIALNTQLEKVG